MAALSLTHQNHLQLDLVDKVLIPGFFSFFLSVFSFWQTWARPFITILCIDQQHSFGSHCPPRHVTSAFSNSLTLYIISRYERPHIKPSKFRFWLRMAPAKDFMRRLSTKLGRTFLTSKNLHDDAGSKEPLLTRRPIGEDEIETVPSSRRMSQGSTICVRAGPNLSGTTLVVRNPTEWASRDSSSTVTPEVQVPASTKERTQPKKITRRSRHATSKDHADAITPPPPRRTESEMSQAPTAVMAMDSERRPALCFMCGKFFGKEKGQTREKMAHLPCGHIFGHECLFRYMLKTSGAGGCPNLHCIPMRHVCEHLTMPKAAPPAETFHDSSVAVLPWNYEFCSSPKGLKYLRTIAESGGKVRRLESQRKNRRRSVMTFTVHSRLIYYTALLEQTEKRLDEAQRIWWTNRWDEFEKKKRQGAWSWQRVKGLSREDADSTNT